MLEVKNLSVNFKFVEAVRNVSFVLENRESLGILGESGSGKSTLALALLRLITPPGKIISGKIILNGRDLMGVSDKELMKIRGAKISMIFQDPFTSLNPVFTIGDQIIETLCLHQGLNRKQARDKAVEMLDLVHIDNPDERINNYPHQFSGGMKQRAMIAMALACNPEILIADEPTTALDTTIQKEILDLFDELKNKLGFSIIFITHNFGIIRKMCSRVLVMQKGEIVEEAKTEDLFNNPKHPYTRELIDSLKVLNAA